MKSFILSIDTSQREHVTVGLEIEGVKKEKTKQRNNTKAQDVLPLISEVLVENQLTPSDLTEIKVHTGPGSFTGLRVGVSIANTFGFVLGIPVNGKKQIVLPIYE